MDKININERRDDGPLWEKLNAIHIDVVESKTVQTSIIKDMAVHEYLLRGKGNNGLCGDMKAVKVTANILKFATGGMISGIIAIWTFLKSQVH